MKLFTSILALSLIWLIAKAAAARSVANRNEVLDCSNSGHTSEDTDYEVENTKQLKKKVKTQTNDVINLGDDRLLTNSIDVESYAADNVQKNNQYSNERFFSHSGDNEKNAVAKPVNLEGCNLTRPSAEQVMDEEAKYDISVSNIEIDPVLKLKENIPSIIETLICDSSMVLMLESIDHNEKCSVCLDSFEEITFQMTPIIKTRCGHCFCIHCLVGVISAAVNKYKCPYCQGLLGDLSNVIIANEHLDLLKMLSVNMSPSQLDEFLVAANCKNAPYVIYKYVIQIVYLSGNYELEKKLLFFREKIPERMFVSILKEAFKNRNNSFIVFLDFTFKIRAVYWIYAIKADNAFETRKNFDLLRTFMLDSCTLINILEELINVNDGLSYYFPTVQYKVDTFVGFDDLNNRQDLQLLEKSLPIISRPVILYDSDCKNMHDVFNLINSKENATIKKNLKIYRTYKNRSTMDGNSFLGNAIMRCNNELVLNLLDHFAADPELANLGGMRPLHIAVWANNAQAVKLLLARRKLLIDSKDSFGFTPIDIASAIGSIEIVTCLLNAGAKFPDDGSIFSKLVLDKYFEKINFSFALAIEHWPQDISAFYFQQILRYAIYYSDFSLFYQISDLMPDFKFVTDPQVFFNLVIKGRRLDTLHILIKFLPCTEYTLRLIPDLVVIALKTHNAEAFDAIIDYKYNIIDFIESNTGNNILHLAILNNSLHLLKKLNSIPNIGDKNTAGESAADIALKAGNSASVEFLLSKNGLEPFKNDKAGKAVSEMLMDLVKNEAELLDVKRKEDILILLFKAGFNMFKSFCGSSALVYCCTLSLKGRIMATLIKTHKLELAVYGGMTMVERAIKNNDLESLTVLSSEVVKDLKQNDFSDSVLMFAIRNKCSVAIMEALVGYGVGYYGKNQFKLKFSKLFSKGSPCSIDSDIMAVFNDAELLATDEPETYSSEEIEASATESECVVNECSIINEKSSIGTESSIDEEASIDENSFNDSSDS